ncbi:NAD(P)-binding protein [Auricularia subglabra TFB-10046 SS5]|nr:NAD(P)-binding protein [Auricularia subglabra TFB-10046 SS5]
MVSSAVIESNNKVSLRGQRAVVSGATQGIGLGVALQFAKSGAEVWIVGRNPKSCAETVEKLKQAAPDGVSTDGFRFFHADLSVVADTARAAREISDAAGERGVDYLLETQGGPANSADTALNADGFDTHFAVQVYSRFALAHGLTVACPVVTRAVLTVACAGLGRAAFDTEDILLEKVKQKGGYGMLSAGIRDCTVIDALWEELARRSPSVRFLHLHPGMVDTAALRNSALPAPLKLITRALGYFFQKTIDEYAHVPFYLVANPEGKERVGVEAHATQWWYNLKPVKPSPASEREEVRRAVWDFMTARLP